MDNEKRRRLEARGWKVGSVQDFLQLAPEEVLLLDIKARLAMTLARHRAQHNLTQVEVAQRLRSSQSRVAKMESANQSVSLDLLVRALLTLGVTRKELAAAVAGK